ncbi:MAG: hypothetical protein R6V13_01100 [Anaerolineae bacterium]
MITHTHHWQPLTVQETVDLLSPGGSPGAGAIDLHLGRQTRSHEDIDVLIRRY